MEKFVLLGMRYECLNCGSKFSSWFGRCPECGEWNTIEEVAEDKKQVSKARSDPAKAVSIKELGKTGRLKRLKTRIEEFDRVLGGGFVPGEVILLTGEPGIGKSTLLLKVSSKLKSLYVSAEEALSQVKHKVERFSLKSQALFFTEEKEIEKILSLVEKEDFELVVIDSLQTVFSKSLVSPAGSIGQLKAVLQLVLETAKKKQIVFVLVGHLTKSGEYAGPKTLEHMVDCVLYIEGDRHLPVRILSSSKNRFGPTDEIGMFEMGREGFKEFFDPLVFLDEGENEKIGSARVAELKGPRILFYEVQALVVPTFLAVPRRVVKGVDQKRVLLLLAALRKYLKVPLEKFDIYISVVGGVNLISPLADLGIAAAILSSLKNKKISTKHLFVGEVDLLGRVRKERFIDKIEKEAKRLKFSKVFSYKNMPDLKALQRVANF